MEWSELRDEVRSVWDDNAAFWDNHVGEEGNVFARTLVYPTAERLLAPQPGWRVLEIACANGNFARRIAPQVAHVLATDVSPQMIEIARARTPETTTNVEFRALDAADPDALAALGDQRFDAAVCNMAIMDMPAIEPLLAALRRLLRPGGAFVFTTMHPCFNSGAITRMVEMSDDGGELRNIYSIKSSHYHTPKHFLGLAAAGQPRPQYYFHRSFSDLFAPCFANGFLLDALEEPVFPQGDAQRALSLSNFAELPPVLAARFRLMGV